MAEKINQMIKDQMWRIAITLHSNIMQIIDQIKKIQITHRQKVKSNLNK